VPNKPLLIHLKQKKEQEKQEYYKNLPIILNRDSTKFKITLVKESEDDK
jgi:hypothetical protein